MIGPIRGSVAEAQTPSTPLRSPKWSLEQNVPTRAITRRVQKYEMAKRANLVAITVINIIFTLVSLTIINFVFESEYRKPYLR